MISSAMYFFCRVIHLESCRGSTLKSDLTKRKNLKSKNLLKSSRKNIEKKTDIFESLTILNYPNQVNSTDYKTSLIKVLSQR